MVLAALMVAAAFLAIVPVAIVAGRSAHGRHLVYGASLVASLALLLIALASLFASASTAKQTNECQIFCCDGFIGKQMRIIDVNQQPSEEWRTGVTTRMRVSAATYTTQLCMFEQWCDPGHGAPNHLHAVEEVLCVREGQAGGRVV